MTSHDYDNGYYIGKKEGFWFGWWMALIIGACVLLLILII